MTGIIYIIFGLVKEKVSLKLGGGGLKSMLYSCPNHEFSREIIIQKIYPMHLVHRDRNYIYNSDHDELDA